MVCCGWQVDDIALQLHDFFLHIILVLESVSEVQEQVAL